MLTDPGARSGSTPAVVSTPAVGEELAVGEDLAVPEELAQAALTLARRFAAGATMWCVSPQWPSHGRHLAVEFVHPVVVGKPAWPSVPIEGSNLAAALRPLARPGDVLIAVSTADDAIVSDLLRRSEAWGLTRVWLGAGRRPASEIAEQVVWSECSDPAHAAWSGELVILYHLLWELTHVVFEHPGLLAAELSSSPDPDELARCAAFAAPTADPGPVCLTCSDHGDVAEVRAVREPDRAEVLVGGCSRLVDVSLVDPVATDDLILVHAGVAIAALGPVPI